MNRIQLSDNFFLDEFTRSQVAARAGIDIVVDVDSGAFRNLQRLCVEVLQPIRNALGPVNISSGYRPPEVNALVGGSRTSAHALALAADFTVSGYTPLEVCRWVQNESNIAYDQLIHEFGQWTHIGLSASVLRNQALTAVAQQNPITGKSKTVYLPGIQPIYSDSK